MEHVDDLFESSSSRDEKVEAVDLLEESWFFENLLYRKTRMFKCHSDLCPSSNFGQEILVKNLNGQEILVKNLNGENTSLTRKLTEDNDFASPDLVRTPSLPSCLGREEGTKEKESDRTMRKLNLQTVDPNLLQTPMQSPTCIGRREGIQEKENDGSSTKLSCQATRQNLLRTPSLPLDMWRKEMVQEEESDPRMSKCTRKASPNVQQHKCLTHSSSLPRCRPPRNLEVETIKSNCTKEMRRRYLNQTKSKKSPSDLEIEEVQGFKDLGFTFDKDLSPSVVNILPGLQQKLHEDLDQDKVRRPYLSEAWCVQSCAPPPIPNWAPKASTEDMKAQIKFWARSVASNMRQEC